MTLKMQLPFCFVLLLSIATFAIAQDESQGGPPPSFESVTHVHGALASLAFVVFLPLGAILLRLLSGPNVIWIHAGIQAFALILIIAATAMGIWMAVTSDQIDSYHPIIGLIILALVITQPFTGLVHHSLYKKYRRRTSVAVAHMWLGRIIITLGIINGGLGLLLAEESKGKKIAYGIIAIAIWAVYIAVAFRAEARRGKDVGVVKVGDE